jgi:TonB family protein
MHAAFFNRVKRAVAAAWHPESAVPPHNPRGEGPRKDLVTVLEVQLDGAGNLVACTIQQPSGIGYLDDEAVAAFRRAQPFAGAPLQLVETDGRIHFNFALILELNGRPTVKVFRSPDRADPPDEAAKEP